MMELLVKKIRSTFKEKFKNSPLLIASPGRINLIGEHIDYNNGFVFPAAIDRYIVSGLSVSKSECTQIYSLDMEEEYVIKLNQLEKLKGGNWKNYIIGVICEIQKQGKRIDNFNLVFGGNIPIGSGLSSSAALENSIAFGLNQLFNLGFNKEELIQISMSAEHNYAGVECGVMDQFSSMLGKKGHLLYLNCADLSCQYIPIELEAYQILLINSNVKHQLTDSPYNQRKKECQYGLSILRKKYPKMISLCNASFDDLCSIKDEISDIVYNRCLYVLEENERVKTASMAIQNKNWEVLGQLLFDSHEGLKDLYEVSCKELDYIVELALNNVDVLGSRLMGGGFGGCTINIVKKNAIESFKSIVKKSYFSKFGHEVDFYEVSISNGTRLVE